MDPEFDDEGGHTPLRDYTKIEFLHEPFLVTSVSIRVLLCVRRPNSSTIYNKLIRQLTVTKLRYRRLRTYHLYKNGTYKEVLRHGNLVYHRSRYLRHLRVSIQYELVNNTILTTRDGVRRYFRPTLHRRLRSVQHYTKKHRHRLRPPTTRHVRRQLYLQVNGLTMKNKTDLTMLPMDRRRLLATREIIKGSNFPSNFFIKTSRITLQGKSAIFRRGIFATILMMVFHVYRRPVRVGGRYFGRSSFPSSSGGKENGPLPRT